MTKIEEIRDNLRGHGIEVEDRGGRILMKSVPGLENLKRECELHALDVIVFHYLDGFGNPLRVQHIEVRERIRNETNNSEQFVKIMGN